MYAFHEEEVHNSDAGCIYVLALAASFSITQCCQIITAYALALLRHGIHLDLRFITMAVDSFSDSALRVHRSL